MEILLAVGLPSAIVSAVVGFVAWYLKRKITEQETKREEREKNIENLMLMIMRTSRATNVLAEATARAVQRIPDAHCNGDMKSALEEAEAIQKKEKDWMFDQGIQHIFGN